MKNIRNEIMRKQLHRMRKNLIPSLVFGIIVVLLCLVSCSYIIKSKTGSDSFIINNFKKLENKLGNTKNQ